MAKVVFLCLLIAILLHSDKCSTTTETTSSPENSSLRSSTPEVAVNNNSIAENITDQFLSTEKQQELNATVVPSISASPLEASALERKFASYVPLHHNQNNVSIVLFKTFNYLRNSEDYIKVN